MISQAQKRLSEVRKLLYDAEPDVFYRGVRPVACCGRKGGAMQASKSRTTQVVAGSPHAFGASGLVELKYSGSRLLFSIQGTVTRTYYEFRKNSSSYVDRQDADPMVETGLFELVQEAALV
jgi:hypothetical protein